MKLIEYRPFIAYGKEDGVIWGVGGSTTEALSEGEGFLLEHYGFSYDINLDTCECTQELLYGVLSLGGGVLWEIKEDGVADICEEINIDLAHEALK